MTAFGFDGTKGAVVGLLSEGLSLSAKEIFSHLEKQGNSLTYQAVHKALAELCEEGVLDRKGNDYLVSMKWLDSMQGQLDSLRAKYSSLEKGFPEQSNFVFDSIAELDSFMIDLFLKLVHDRKDKPVLCLQWNHFWLPLFEREDYLHSRQLGVFSRAYGLSRGNSAIDKWCQQFWSKNKVATKIGCNIANVADIIAFEDMVIEVFYPQEIRKLLDKEYKKIKKMSQLDVDALFERVFQKKTKIPVVIIRNKLIADRIKQQTIELCK